MADYPGCYKLTEYQITLNSKEVFMLKDKNELTQLVSFEFLKGDFFKEKFNLSNSENSRVEVYSDIYEDCYKMEFLNGNIIELFFQGRDVEGVEGINKLKEFPNAELFTIKLSVNKNDNILNILLNSNLSKTYVDLTKSEVIDFCALVGGAALNKMENEKYFQIISKNQDLNPVQSNTTCKDNTNEYNIEGNRNPDIGYGF